MNIENNDYKIRDGVLVGVNPGLKSLNIPEGVTSIAFHACYHNGHLEEIYIPNSVITIESSAFEHCFNLKKVHLSENMTFFDQLFENCISLEEINIPGNIKRIGYMAFSGCRSLKRVNLSEGLTAINECAFENCISLEEITMPSSLIKIEYNAFLKCHLKRVNLSEGLTTIRNFAFEKCWLLEEITIPESVTNLGPKAFVGCSSLKKFSISNECNILFDGDKVTIEYLDINSLNINLIYAVLANKESAKNIEFKSPQYSFFSKEKEKKLIKELFKELVKDRNVTFIKDKKIVLSEVNKEKKYENEISSQKDEDDIKHLEDEIIYLCKDFPKKIASIITEKVNEIDRVYKSSIESFKPEYGKDNGDRFDYEGLKNDTYLFLNRIKSLIDLFGKVLC